MARKAGPFDLSVFYEVENRRLQRALAATASPTGFYSAAQGAVTAGTGAQLVIAAYPDGALIDGMYVENPASETVTLTTNTASTNPRIDRLVLRLDMSAKTIAPFQIVGTPAASPSAPALTNTATVVDLPLCRYTFPGSASAQNPGSIIDERVFLFGATSAPLALPLPGSFTAEPSNGYGAPEGRLMPWGEVLLSGMVRQPVQSNSTAVGGVLQNFTDPIPVALRPSGPRHLGVAATASGPCDVYYRTEGVLAYAFQQTTVVYNTPNWFISLTGLSYFK